MSGYPWETRAELPHNPNSNPKTARLSQKRYYLLREGGKPSGATLGLCSTQGREEECWMRSDGAGKEVEDT